MRAHSMWSRALALSLGWVMIAGVVSSTPAIAQPTGRDVRKPDTQTEKNVPGEPAKLRPVSQIAASNQPVAKVAWPVPSKSDVTAAGDFRQAGISPIKVSKAETTPLRVETFGQDMSAKVGVAGVVLKVSDKAGESPGKTSVQVDYAGFDHAYGGDYGSRLRLVQLPSCALSTPDKAECRTRTPLSSRNDVKAKKLTVTDVATNSGAMVLAAEPAAGGAGGSFQATTLSPAGSWSAGGSSGDFTYNYPIKLPGSVGGNAPQVALGYSSGGVDGRTSATNNQASSVGDGWDLSAGGFIERRYKSCGEDLNPVIGQKKTADLCWATDNATIQLAGISSELVNIPNTNQWRPKNDDGSKIERLNRAPVAGGDDNGEYWKVTTPNGTQYFLGSREAESTLTVPVFGNHPGEQCWAENKPFKELSCRQAWRWTVDYVVDPKGNVTRFYYQTEKNRYGRNLDASDGVEYERAGRLRRIDYGLHSSDDNAPAPARIEFHYSQRCVPANGFDCDPGKLNKDNAKQWPDVPFDQICAPGAKCENQYSPTFFSQLRLTKISTQVRKENVAAEWRDVDQWDLGQSFPPSNDGLDPALWLDSLKHTGLVGGAKSLPETKFERITLANRVDGDDYPPLLRGRIKRVQHEAGGITEVEYTDKDCVPGQRMPNKDNAHLSTLRCFPSYWTPEGATAPQLHWFHKYVVRAVIADDRVRQLSEQTKVYYEYESIGNAALWHYDENDFGDVKYRTWSQWRGYNKVRTISGDVNEPDRPVTEKIYLRGMDGDTVPGGKRDAWVEYDGERIEDVERLKGFEWKTLVKNGDAVHSKTTSEPWMSSVPTAVNGEDKALLLNTASVVTKTHLGGDRWRTKRASTTFDDAHGRTLKVQDEGDVDNTGDERCTATTYASNEAAWMWNYASRILTYAAKCDAAATDDNTVSDTISEYDDQKFGDAPTRGLVTTASRWNGERTNPRVYQAVTTTEYDIYGRVKKTTDPALGGTSTAYEPAFGFPVRKVTTTNAKEHASAVEYDPALGLPVAQIGANGERIDAKYDALGRLTHTWLPHRERDLSASATYEYIYDESTATVIEVSKSLRDTDEEYNVSYKIFDGLLRPRQTQTPDGEQKAGELGRVITDTFYDSRGLGTKTNTAFFNNQAPDGKLLVVLDAQVPNQEFTKYDKLSRPVSVAYHKFGTQQWKTTTVYAGDRVHVTPPPGQIPTTVVTDVHGREVERIQHNGVGADSTKSKYNFKGQLEKVTDPAGNSWSYEYDLLGRKKKETDPDRGATTVEYNNLDQVVKTTDSENRSVSFRYDQLGRKTEMLSGTTTLAKWTYDSKKKGLLDSSTRYSGGQAYVQRITRYDAFSRVRESEVEIPETEGALSKTYRFERNYTPVSGALLSSQTPAAGGLTVERVSTIYNDLGAPIKTGGLDTYVGGHVYSKFGETLRMTLGSEKSPDQLWLTNYFEEGTRRLEQSIVDRSRDTDYRIANNKYSYDTGGNVTRIADEPSDKLAWDTQCFRYDNLRRLTKAFTPSSGDCTTSAVGGVAPYQHDYEYDSIGNRTLERTTTSSGVVNRKYNYDPANQPHVVRSIDESGPSGTARDEFGYDKTGNTSTRKVAGNTQTVSYDGEGRTSKVTEAFGKESSYLYDADGGRLIKREPGRTTLYLPEGMELVKDDATNQVSGKRYYAHGGTVVAVRHSSGRLSYEVGNHQSTPTLSVKAGELTYQRQYFDPFGKARGPNGGSWADDKGFVGGTRDVSGLTHLGAREYDPATGRFLSDDPIMNTANPQQVNGYSYSNNNPVTFSDPSGMYLEGGNDKDTGNPYGIDKERNIIVGNWLGGDEASAAAYPTATNKRRKAHAAHNAAQQARYDAFGGKDKYEEYLREANSTQTWWDVVVAELPELLMDLTGISDVRDCFTKFDLLACVSLVPAAKVFKLLQASERIARAIIKANRVVDKIRGAWARLRKVEEKAEEAAEAAVECLTNSFVPGTRVLMADGSSKPIEQIKLGDKVLATDPETGESRGQDVVRTIVGDGSKNLVELTVDGQAEKIVATDGHRFWLPELKKWLRADRLTAGVWLQTSAGTWVQVVQVRKWTATQRVHNLTISGEHTYYVLAGGIAALAHNCGDQVVAAVLSEAEAVADLSKSQRPNAIEALQVGDNPPIIGNAVPGGGGRRVHPVVQGLLDEIKPADRGRNHGGCGLVQCLTVALDSGLDPTGASAAAVMGRSRANANFKTLIGPCPSCQVLVDHFGINFKGLS